MTDKVIRTVEIPQDITRHPIIVTVREEWCDSIKNLCRSLYGDSVIDTDCTISTLRIASITDERFMTLPVNRFATYLSANSFAREDIRGNAWLFAWKGGAGLTDKVPCDMTDEMIAYINQLWEVYVHRHD